VRNRYAIVTPRTIRSGGAPAKLKCGKAGHPFDVARIGEELQQRPGLSRQHQGRFKSPEPFIGI